MAVLYEIYGKNNCSYCVKAKKLLESYGRPYKYINIENDMDEFFAIFPEAKTVPQILLDDIIIGGYTELEKHCKETW